MHSVPHDGLLGVNGFDAFQLDGRGFTLHLFNLLALLSWSLLILLLWSLSTSIELSRYGLLLVLIIDHLFLLSVEDAKRIEEQLIQPWEHIGIIGLLDRR